jgi:hypothetical protein
MPVAVTRRDGNRVWTQLDLGDLADTGLQSSTEGLTAISLRSSVVVHAGHAGSVRELG